MAGRTFATKAHPHRRQSSPLRWAPTFVKTKASATARKGDHPPHHGRNRFASCWSTDRHRTPGRLLNGARDNLGLDVGDIDGQVAAAWIAAQDLRVAGVAANGVRVG